MATPHHWEQAFSVYAATHQSASPGSCEPPQPKIRNGLRQSVL